MRPKLHLVDDCIALKKTKDVFLRQNFCRQSLNSTTLSSAKFEDNSFAQMYPVSTYAFFQRTKQTFSPKTAVFIGFPESFASHTTLCLFLKCRRAAHSCTVMFFCSVIRGRAFSGVHFHRNLLNSSTNLLFSCSSWIQFTYTKTCLLL